MLPDAKSCVTHLSQNALMKTLNENLYDPDGPHKLNVSLKEDRSEYPRALHCDTNFPRTNMKQAWIFSTDGSTAGIVTSQEVALKLITLWLAKENAHLYMSLSNRWSLQVRNVDFLIAELKRRCDNLLQSDAKTFLERMLKTLSKPSAHDLIKSNIWLGNNEPHPNIIDPQKLFH